MYRGAGLFWKLIMTNRTQEKNKNEEKELNSIHSLKTTQTIHRQ